MATARPAVRPRPLSPHLTIWKWGPHMAVSILHRATGDGMALVGTIVFVWWLAALAGGPASYQTFLGVFTWHGGALNPLGYLIGIGLTAAFFQHMLSGIRHLMMDTGAGYELGAAKRSAQATFIGSVVLTVLYWAWLVFGK